MTHLEELLERLVKNEVEFVVVGGFAAIAHGASVATFDVDICCRMTDVNLLRIQDALADFIHFIG